MGDKVVANLVMILEEEYDLYNKLVQLAAEKKETIIDNKIEELSELVQREDGIIDEIKEFETSRGEKITELCEVYGISADEVSFNQLLEYVTGSVREDLIDIREKLLEVIDNLNNMNEQNRLLIDEAIKLNQFSFNMIIKALEPANQTYDGKSDRSEKKVSSHLVDRRG